jgi:hypothetical protein
MLQKNNTFLFFSANLGHVFRENAGLAVWAFAKPAVLGRV